MKKEHLELHWDANSEGMIWTEDGKPLQGLTGGGERIEWTIPESFRDGKQHTFYIEMACNGMFGNAVGDIIQAPDPNRYFQLQKADIVAVNLEARALYIDFWILKDAAREFPREGWQEHEALSVANEVMNCFEVRGGDQECIRQCRKIAAKYLGKNADSSKVYDDSKALVTAIGHCHIDTCWLWPWAETKRKIARSWSNQCDLIDRYPEHRFCCSQAQQYKWLKMYYPSVFDRVKTKIKEGKFQPIGGSWVEHDTNMPSGESLVRQFLYGQRFFESHFGQRSRTFWLPDTFGYSSQLPQVCRLAGMDRFFTQKLSWNNINNYPHTTFNWVGIDNSQVLCHMAPAETYTAEADFGDVVRSMSQHKSKDQDATSILPFGKGDGGGGPTWQQIEKLRRCRGISDNVGQLAPVKVGDSVDDFFARLEKKAEEGTQYVSWHGELYLELHRGCYTTQAKNKRNNRFAERMLHDIEYYATFASIKEKSYKYPKADIDAMWEDVLLMQFHDCLPGSCIGMVYQDSDELYKKVFQTGEKLLKHATSTVLLPLEHPYIDHTPLAQWTPPERTAFIEQTGDDAYVLKNAMYTVTIAEGVITSLTHHGPPGHERELIPAGAKGNQLVLFDDKPLYWQAWDVEVYHLNTRKELKPSSSRISCEELDVVGLTTTTHISDKSSISTTIYLRSGPSFRSGCEPQISFHSTVSWHETQKFLKVEFPTTLLSNTGTASYETQYGVITRPVHYNTSWDQAKFEVVSHRFADLSESNYGLSVLNDSKYGFSVHGSTMRLSLLRAPKAPDDKADMGTHHFRYALLPHGGTLGNETVSAARNFNSPMEAPMYPSLDGKEIIEDIPMFPHTTIHNYYAGDRCKIFMEQHILPISVADRSGHEPTIVLDTIKRGEDDEDVRANAEESSLPIRHGRSIVVRVYDPLGGRRMGYMEFHWFKVNKVFETSALEDDVREIEILEREDEARAYDTSSSRGFHFQLNPFEVKTFRLCLDEDSFLPRMGKGYLDP